MVIDLTFDHARVPACLRMISSDDLAGRFAVVGKVDLAAAASDAGFERFQMLVELGQRGVFDRAGLLPQQIGLGQGREGVAIPLAQRVAQVRQRRLQTGVGQRRVGRRQEFVMLVSRVIGGGHRVILHDGQGFASSGPSGGTSRTAAMGVVDVNKDLGWQADNARLLQRGPH